MLALVGIGALALAGQAAACTFDNWKLDPNGAAGNGKVQTAAGQLVTAQPYDAPDAVSRYSGKCAALSKSIGNYVQDGSPGQEKKYFVQFYVYTGLSSGGATVYRANNSTPAKAIQVDYNRGDGTNGNFTISASTSTVVNSIAANKWYMISLAWSASPNPNTMTVTVQGGGGANPIANAVAVTTAGDNIETAQLGWVSGAGTVASGVGAPGIVTDAFVSQRSTPPVRLCRGDANSDTFLGGQDIILIRNEFLNGNAAISTGTPDANEDGFVAGQDIVVVRNRFLANEVCP